MKVFLDSIGCRLNQSEIEHMALQFRAAGHSLVDSAAEADLVVVNTCAVTTQASSDSRQKIRQAHRSGPAAIAVTGCWSTLDPAAAEALPGVQWVIPNVTKDELVPGILHLPASEMDQESLARQPLPGLHWRTRAFIKAQDGCDNFCTFCVTRLARGKGHSIPAGEIVKDVRRAVEGGAKEIVLTGVHLGSWGRDFETPLTLGDLIETLLKESGFFARLRLSSLEPWDLDHSFFSLWQDERMCRHLHLPLQSGSAGTLRRMARKITPQSYAALLSQARSFIPGLAVTTDIIAGFPGETDDEFAETLDYVKQAAFAGGHVFTFSARPGTAAARYPDPVAPAVRKERGAALRAVLAAAGEVYRVGFTGQVMPVLWEASSGLGPAGWKMEGLTSNYLRVRASSPEKLWNQISQVRLDSVSPDGMEGEII